MTKLGRALRAGLLGKARALFHGLGRNGEHPSRKPRCSTCGTDDPDANWCCSNGFHAKGATYWPIK